MSPYSLPSSPLSTPTSFAQLTTSTLKKAFKNDNGRKKGKRENENYFIFFEFQFFYQFTNKVLHLKSLTNFHIHFLILKIRNKSVTKLLSFLRV